MGVLDHTREWIGQPGTDERVVRLLLEKKFDEAESLRSENVNRAKRVALLHRVEHWVRGLLEDADLDRLAGIEIAKPPTEAQLKVCRDNKLPVPKSFEEAAESIRELNKRKVRA